MTISTEQLNGLLKQVAELIHPKISAERIAVAKKRQVDTLCGRAPDYVPLLITKMADKAGALPDFNWSEQWHDSAISLYMQLKDIVLPAVSVDSDLVPMARADTGIINCMSLFGVEYDVSEHTKPVVTKYVEKDALAEFQLPADISGLGIMPRMIEHIQPRISQINA